MMQPPNEQSAPALLASWSDADTILADPLVSDALAFMDRQPRVTLEGRR